MRAQATWTGSSFDFGHIEESILIDRSIDEVWAFANDQFNRPRRAGGGTVGSRQTTPGPMGVGSVLQSRTAIPILGFETRIDASITEWDPPHAMTLSVMGRHSGPFRSFTGRTTMEAVPGGTRVVRMGDAKLRPAYRVLWLFLGRFVKRMMIRRNNLGTLKQLIEAEPE